MLSGAEQMRCIEYLWRGARRFHIASLQDQNPIVAARHNGYAVALVDALRDVSTEEEVRRVTHGSLKRLREGILRMQDRIEGQAMKIYVQLRKAGVKIPGMRM